MGRRAMDPSWTGGSDQHDGRAILKDEFMSPEISLFNKAPKLF